MDVQEAAMILHAALRLRRERVTGDSTTAKERERQRITAAIDLIDHDVRFSHMPAADAEYIQGLLEDGADRRLRLALHLWQ